MCVVNISVRGPRYAQSFHRCVQAGRLGTMPYTALPHPGAAPVTPSLTSTITPSSTATLARECPRDNSPAGQVDHLARRRVDPPLRTLLDRERPGPHRRCHRGAHHTGKNRFVGMRGAKVRSEGAETTRTSLRLRHRHGAREPHHDSGHLHHRLPVADLRARGDDPTPTPAPAPAPTLHRTSDLLRAPPACGSRAHAVYLLATVAL